MKGQLFVVYGTTSSGTGKTEIVNGAMAHVWSAARVITCTTREPRKGEVNGVHYHFLTMENFRKGIDAGDFVEFDAHYDQFYGTRQSDIEAALRTHSAVFLITDLNGALTLKRTMTDAVFIAIGATPEEVLKRMRRRGDSEKSIEKRNAALSNEQTLFAKIGADHVVWNRDGKLEQATNEFIRLVVLQQTPPKANIPE